MTCVTSSPKSFTRLQPMRVAYLNCMSQKRTERQHAACNQKWTNTPTNYDHTEKNREPSKRLSRQQHALSPQQFLPLWRVDARDEQYVDTVAAAVAYKSTDNYGYYFGPAPAAAAAS